MKANGSKTSLSRALASALLAFVLCAPAGAAPRYKVLHAFGKGKDGGGLWSPVTLDKKGSLYGATSGGGTHGQGIVFQLLPHPDGVWHEAILHSFPSSPEDGQGPNGGLIQDASRHWYGTTAGGGADHTAGTVFQLTHGAGGWKESPIYSFGTQHEDEGQPWAGPIMDGSGNLYGTTRTTAFELAPGADGWHERVLHRFGIENGDGSAPYAGLILDPGGNLYGTTRYGGTGCGGEGCGVVYELSPTLGGKWKETILHRFDDNGKDGAVPGWGALFMDGSGRLYGTTENGGSGTGFGTVFRLTPNAEGHWQETILYSFESSGGSGPGAGVVMDKVGNLYGTTIYGGSACGCGVVYKLAPGPEGKWKYTVLHTFQGYDGAQPDANLILDNQGNLYGTTATGGTYGAGVAFELTP